MTNEPGESDDRGWQSQLRNECELQSGTEKSGGLREGQVSSLGQIR